MSDGSMQAKEPLTQRLSDRLPNRRHHLVRKVVSKGVQCQHAHQPHRDGPHPALVALRQLEVQSRVSRATEGW